MYVYLYVCMYVCISVCVYDVCMYLYMYSECLFCIMYLGSWVLCSMSCIPWANMEIRVHWGQFFKFFFPEYDLVLCEVFL